MFHDTTELDWRKGGARSLRSDFATGEFTFAMEQEIPAYLIAIAVGDLEYRAFGPRSGVWAEPSVIEAAAAEFDDTPAMIAQAEELFGPYRWEQYDLLVLPPAFSPKRSSLPTFTVALSMNNVLLLPPALNP